MGEFRVYLTAAGLPSEPGRRVRTSQPWSSIELMQVSGFVSGMMGFGADLKREKIRLMGQKITLKTMERTPPRILNGSSVSGSQSSRRAVSRDSPTGEGPKETVRF